MAIVVNHKQAQMWLQRRRIPTNLMSRSESGGQGQISEDVRRRT